MLQWSQGTTNQCILLLCTCSCIELEASHLCLAAHPLLCPPAGGTWHCCTSTLANGGLVVCSCKSGAADDGAQATGGILFNRCYSVVATLTLPAGPQRPQPVKLLRLQCPWGAQGLWQGPWSQGAEEWGPAGEVGTVAAAVGAMQQAGGDSTRGAGQWGLESDPTTCWINYW
jgi:hypothetical protein